MTEQKKIDVVIPAYKPGEKFQKLIKMLQKQTYPVHEILIMNTEKAYFPEASVAGLPNVRVEHVTREESFSAFPQRKISCGRQIPQANSSSGFMIRFLLSQTVQI